MVDGNRLAWLLLSLFVLGGCGSAASPADADETGAEADDDDGGGETGADADADADADVDGDGDGGFDGDRGADADADGDADGCTATCGNGSVECSEECDDGNLTSGDGCDDTCAIEPSPTCGDGTVDLAAGEECDDANTTDGDGCSSDCRVEAPATCGDGTLDLASGEQCDDGNTINGDGCSSACRFETVGATCGDGTVDLLETCDDGNTVNGDACNPTCNLANTTTLFAGSPGSAGSVDGIGAAARFGGEGGMAVDDAYLYLGDGRNNNIRRIEIATATVTTRSPATPRVRRPAGRRPDGDQCAFPGGQLGGHRRRDAVGRRQRQPPDPRGEPRPALRGHHRSPARPPPERSTGSGLRRSSRTFAGDLRRGLSVHGRCLVERRPAHRSGGAPC